MKAIRVKEFGGPEVLKLEDVPELKPASNEVVVRIRAAGVNPVETYIRAGTYARKPSLPYTPGTDGAGTIESVGKDAKRFSPGARVYVAGSLSGTYAEQALCDEANVFALPEHVSFAQGAAMGIPYGTAYRGLFQRAHARAGESVLIHGASGGTGIAATQLARAAGLRVVGTAGSDRGRTLVKAEGAHETLDHKSPDHFDKALSLTGGRGYDVIIEFMTVPNLTRDLGILAHGGRVVVIGSNGNVEITPRDIMARDAAILGMSLWNVSPPDSYSIHSALAAGLENKTLRPVVAQEIPLADAARAHSAIREGSAAGKIVLVP
jgi:NADPH2:quinone reductase